MRATASPPRNTPPPALVVGLDCLTGLQTARILAGHGVPVIALAKNRQHYCARTRVCQQIIETDTGTEAFIQTLEELGPTLPQRAVLFPCTDSSVWLISRHRARLAPWYYIALPRAEILELLMDKIGFYEFAQQANLPIPRTFLLKNRAAAEQAAAQLTYPCILKPPLKTRTWEQHTKAKVYKVASAAEFLTLYDQCCQWTEVLMAQEWIEGTDASLYSCNCYFNVTSQPLVTFIARKLRQWPPETGTSCLGEECQNDFVLRESLRLFQEAGYYGLGYVEMKRDERTGQHFIIEPNIGRPTGRSAIAEAGGVALLYTMYCDCVGWPLPANREQAYGGVKWLDLRRDFQSALHYWRRGELSLGDWWRSWQGPKGHAVFSWTDPAPFWHDLWRAVGLALKSD